MTDCINDFLKSPKTETNSPVPVKRPIMNPFVEEYWAKYATEDVDIDVNIEPDNVNSIKIYNSNGIKIYAWGLLSTHPTALKTCHTFLKRNILNDTELPAKISYRAIEYMEGDYQCVKYFVCVG